MFLSEIAVSLLVRLWVEMSFVRSHPGVYRRQPPCEAVSWNSNGDKVQTSGGVSLLVRLWVEIILGSKLESAKRSASLWGCELKCMDIVEHYCVIGQPPCEAVSWNAECNRDIKTYFVSLLVRLWVEMYDRGWNDALEKVSLLVRLWVEMFLRGFSNFDYLSASLWGCELKWFSSAVIRSTSDVSLLVRLWVEILIYL